MDLHSKKKTVKIGESEITLETGKVARQANGAVWLHLGETIVMATACMSKEPLEDVDFLPLRVDYQEKFSAAGKTLGGFIKREGRPTQRETLVCRLIDRPIRPMFEDGYYHDTQVLATVLSYDGQHKADTHAICAASAALTISEIPLIKPLGAVRVGLVGGNFIVNPTVEQMEKSSLDLVMAGTEDAVLMIEGYCDFLPEEQLLEGIEAGHAAIRTFCHALAEWREEVGKPKKLDTLRKLPEATKKAVADIAEAPLKEALKIAEKQQRDETIAGIKEKVVSTLLPEGGSEHTKFNVSACFKKLQARVMRRATVETKKRVDGRALDQVRGINIQMGPLPRVHGSCLFTRGETQAIAVATLGGTTMAQRYEDLHGDSSERFYLQYFFPPYSVGEVGRMGPAGRREVGHGKLAERAISYSLPSQEEFPYVIRLESNITESNGSSSMASVCGGCLALMEAGVPIKRPVSGIAMGLILEEDGATILSDILGVEDALGDMDFKVTGDDKGVTAFQMDIKVEGITTDIMGQALSQAKAGRVHILEKMVAACPAPKKMADHAPRIEVVMVPPSKIGAIIGPGGKQIRAIVEETGVQVDIDDSGAVSLAAADQEGMEQAKAIIHGLTAEIEIGTVYQGTVKSVVPFGVFVEVMPGKEGLCHVSELDEQRVEDTASFIKVGDPIVVKVLDINERGQVRLSRKATLAK